ncbi:MAG TPA: flagellar basal-body rod protein FlgF, partial [Rhodospirillaceae bacterium]|nr:flagellar basal-body rod protein FlgF [Rhodospirillaceae bacterium]
GAQSVSIDGRGVISADGARVAQLSVVEFTDPAALTPIGNGLAVTDQAPQEGAVSRVASGVVESSNVEPVVEMTGMVEILRSYQSMQRLLQAENDRLRGAIEKLAKV